MIGDDKAKNFIASMVKRIDGIFRGLDETNSWKTCRICQEKWTKLRPCQWQSEGQSGSDDQTCVHCAETVVALPWIAERYPMGLEITLRGHQALLKYGEEFVYRMWVDGMRLRVRRESMPGQVSDYDNVYAAYFAICGAIRAGDDPNPQKGANWASAVKFGSDKRTGERRRQQKFRD